MKVNAATTPPPPPPCTGAGIVPPFYQGMTMMSSLAFGPAPCAICGQTIAVDSFMRTVNHPYLPTADSLVRQLAGDFDR